MRARSRQIDRSGGRPVDSEAPTPEQLRTKALRFLDRRDRTVAEVRRRLGDAGGRAGDIDAVVTGLVVEGILDDERYAVAFTEDRRAIDSWGGDRIRSNLVRRGISVEVVERAVATGVETEAARARELLSRRYPGGIAGPRETQRAVGMLARRGFGLELAGEIVYAFSRDAVSCDTS